MYSHSLQKFLIYGKAISSSNVHFWEMATQWNTRQLFLKKKKENSPHIEMQLSSRHILKLERGTKHEICHLLYIRKWNP